MAAHQAPRPWNFPSKNTGVGCHFLLQCMKVKSESEVAQLCLTRHDPTDCSLPGSFVHVIFQARVLEWVAIAFSDQRTNPREYEIVKTHTKKPLAYKTWHYPTTSSTLCNSVDGSPPGSPSLGFSRQEHWSGLPFPSPMHESEK